MKRTTLACCIAAAVLGSCKQDNLEDIEEGHATPFTMDLPSYFPAMDVPADNPLTVEGIALGRMLYHDPQLSSAGPQAGHSCSSCHEQATSFSVPDAGTAVLPHINLAWNTNFLWTGHVQGSLEDIMKFEVEEFFQVDVGVLEADPDYPPRFDDVFGPGGITRERVAMALAQWFRRLVSTNSRFDRFLRNEEALTPQEMAGMTIFFTEKGDCFHCHGQPLMTDNAFHNIGLDSVFTGANTGRYAETGDPDDLGKFKAPTLRNIALTAPYMHDGRFATLEEVVEQYNSGVQWSPSLDPLMNNTSTGLELGLNPAEKGALLAFLHALTDTSFVNDPALSDPF